MLITRISQISGKQHTLEVNCTPEQLQNWEKGMHIQNAMPNVSREHREFIISGITPEEWEEMFGKLEE